MVHVLHRQGYSLNDAIPSFQFEYLIKINQWLGSSVLNLLAQLSKHLFVSCGKCPEKFFAKLVLGVKQRLHLICALCCVLFVACVNFLRAALDLFDFFMLDNVVHGFDEIDLLP
jgi:hypothetical protein